MRVRVIRNCVLRKFLPCPSYYAPLDALEKERKPLLPPDNQQRRTIPSPIKTIESPFFSGVTEKFLDNALKFCVQGCFYARNSLLYVRFQQDHGPNSASIAPPSRVYAWGIHVLSLRCCKKIAAGLLNNHQLYDRLPYTRRPWPM